ASTEPRTKIAMPTNMIGFRPYRSESLPNTTVIAVCASRKDANTQLYRCSPPSSEAICGITVETMVASMATMAMEAMIDAMTRGRLVVLAVDVMSGGCYRRREPLSAAQALGAASRAHAAPSA